LHGNRDPDLAVIGELHGVGDEVEQDLPQLAHIALHRRQWRFRQDRDQSQSLLFGHRGHQKRDVTQGFGKVEGHDLVCRLALFQLGVVEDAVQKPHQPLARGQRRVQPGHLLGRQPASRQVAQHAEDPVHRGADFMAHHRQEFGLCPVRRLGPVAGCIMGGHFAAQDLGLFIDQVLKLAAMAAQFLQMTLAFGGEFAVGDGLLAKDLDRTFHSGNLVRTGLRDFLAEVALGKARHPLGKCIQPPDQVAADIEPQDRHRQHKRQHRGKGVKLLRRQDRLLRRLAGRYRAGLDPVGKGRGRSLQLQRCLAQFSLGPGDLVGQGQHATCRFEQGRGLWRRGRGRSDHAQKHPHPVRPPRVLDRIEPSGNHLDPGRKFIPQGLQIRLRLHARHPVQQKADLGGMRPQLEHQAHLEEVDFDQLVQRVQPCLRIGRSGSIHPVKAGNHR
jgi:hypothetical protein